MDNAQKILEAMKAQIDAQQREIELLRVTILEKQEELDALRLDLDLWRQANKTTTGEYLALKEDMSEVFQITKRLLGEG